MGMADRIMKPIDRRDTRSFVAVRCGAAFWVALAVWVLVVAGGTRLAGQTIPSMSNRQGIATALNNALAGSQTSVAAGSTELFDAVANACGSVGALDFEIVYAQDHFVLRRKLRAGHAIGGLYTHPLVDDLNRWLNTVWGMDLRSIPEFDELSWACDNPNQRYFLRSTADAQLVQALQEATGELGMLNKSYVIDGVAYEGRDILTFTPPGMSPRTVSYISDLGSGSDPRRRLLAGAYIKVTCPNGGPVVEIRFDVQLENYDPDCGTPKGPGLNIELTGTGIGCAFLQNGGSPNSVNAEVIASYLEPKWVLTPELVPPNFSTPANHRQGQLGKFDITDQGELRFRMPHSNVCNYDEQVMCRLISVTADDEYCETAYCLGGTFSVDATGHLVYSPPVADPCGVSCAVQPVPCIEFCDYGTPSTPTVAAVIRAEARTFSDRIESTIEADVAGSYGSRGEYEIGVRGKWRPERAYVYRTATVPGSGLFATNPGAASERNYNDAGTFPLRLFSWRDPGSAGAEWLNTTTVTRYARNGEPVEERDILGTYSAARFGHGGQVPILVARNCPYYGPIFDAFEEDHFDANTNNGVRTSVCAHSGSWSYRVPDAGVSEPIVQAYYISPDASNAGMVLRLWTKYTYPSPPAAWESDCPVTVQLEASGGGGTMVFPNTGFRFVARTGEWDLYEYEVPAFSGLYYDLTVKKAAPASDVWIDDIRLQPRASDMACYVYDPKTLKPVVVFDDQHFGVYYQYNGEGRLIRKIRETERGMRTVEEAQYHVPTIARDYASGNVSGTARIGDPPGRTVAALNGRVHGDAMSDTAGGDRISVLEAEFGLARRNVKVFGVDPEKLAERFAELKRVLELPELSRVRIPGAEKLQALDELVRADDTLAALSDRRERALDAGERDGIRTMRMAAERRRTELLRTLGIDDEDEARRVIEEARRLRAAAASSEGAGADR